jgi:mono/diheme cytochrome c family protein
MTRRARVTFTVAASLLLCLAIGCRGRADDEVQRTPAAQPADATAHVVTPVAGESWIKHLGVSVEDTRMGQMGGSSPPPETPRQEPSLEAGGGDRLGTSIRRFFELSPDEGASRPLEEPFVITGADLYRLNCQSCHGPNGEGAPPEINSLRGPVEGTSPSLILRRMRERGTPIDEDYAKELAAQTEKPLRDRLVHGGKKMPPFPHLEGEEVEALLGYLKRLVGAPEVEGADLRVTETAARVGEHLVKGTCHVCHDATGPGGGHMMMMRRGIPSLASFPEQKSAGDVIRKVREGASGMMGMMGVERMPRFPYVTEEEITAAYLYLAIYPPQP